ncbi:MAG: pitrilysin family protein [Pirellulaceae bacterium]
MLMRSVASYLLLALLLIVPNCLWAQGLEKVTEVEGITQYKLENGIPVLLFPDKSKPKFTVNMTVLVGSRHEGYGETGMAHLLEHMLFKGTETHKDIPALLKERGVLNMNGTTWYDRTNYFETLPAGDENLEFAIRMEADRLVNSLIRGEDLQSEMTVVRNEFEMGENSPMRILMQRLMANAFEWHNYGKSTIGNRSDIERVPVENLRAFYNKFYQPDNVMIVVAGDFDTDKALSYLQKYFGTLPVPQRELPKTYTEEPVQDGEREVMLRRTGQVQMAGVVYHLPAASDPDFAACEVLSTILGIEPSGRLYKAMVEPKIASSVSTMVIGGHDPGALLCFAEVPMGSDLQKAKATLLEQIESLGSSTVTDEEVKRAVQRLQKQREEQFSDSENTAIELSEWYAYGDWRLYFYFRDQLEKVTAADVQRVAKQYLLSSNRTTGLFIPTDNPERATLPAKADIAAVLKDYKGRAKIAAGEAFNPNPENIKKLTTRGELKSGIKYAFLPKKTRGERVVLNGQIHFGSLEGLKGKRTAAEYLGSLMNRGTKSLSFEKLRDELDKTKTTLAVTSTSGKLTFNLQTKRENLPAALELLRQVLREPSLDQKELEIVATERVTQMEEMLADPQGQAINAISRAFNQYTADDPRYSATLEEEIAALKALKVEEIRTLYTQFLNGTKGELAITGDFDPAVVQPALESIFTNWTTKEKIERIAEPAPTGIKGQRVTINTPDKANAVFVACQMMPVRDDHPDYEALVIGNYILGGGPLSSRLADRVRKKEGLSYGVGSMVRADSHDERTMLMMFAISNPQNSEKVVQTVDEEVKRLLDSGVAAEELDKAKASYLETRKGQRANDAQLAQLLVENLDTGRDMDFQANSDSKIQLLDKARVDKALKSLIDPNSIVIVTAGDFEKAKKAKDEAAKDAKEKASEQSPKK